MWNKKKIEIFQCKLVDWYNSHQRNLPWRNDINAYRIWISEIMLQQTQVRTVIPYFDRFLKRFPDIESLAAAPETEVINYWAGLGYYSRARNIHRAARQVVEKHGNFPQEFSSVLALPGIGRYTAGAICSIAFNQPFPIVDGNIRRVLTRLEGMTNRVAETYFWDRMSTLVPPVNPSVFNQAMMELGALVCTPGRPDCRQCPVLHMCRARKCGIEASIPQARRRQPVRKMTIVLLVLERNREILLSSGNSNLIPGTWGLPWKAVAVRELPRRAAATLCKEVSGSEIPLEPLEPVRHSIMSYQLTALGFCGKIEFCAEQNWNKSLRWMSVAGAENSLTSSLYSKILGKWRSGRR